MRKRIISLMMTFLFLLTLMTPFKITSAKEDQKIKIDGNHLYSTENLNAIRNAVPEGIPDIQNGGLQMFKIENNIVDGEYADDYIRIKLNIYSIENDIKNENGDSYLDWECLSSDYQIYYVFVKASPGGYLYWYNNGEVSDTGLHGLEHQDGGGKCHELSHVEFYYKKKPPTPPPQTGSLKVIKRAIEKDGEDQIFKEGVFFQLTSGIPGDNNTGTSISTDVNGEALFVGLTPGIYILNETVPDGYTTDLAVNTEVVITAGETTTKNVLNTKYGNIKIEKTKVDSQGGTPQPHSGVEFKVILGENDFLVRTTDENGCIEFPPIPVGEYTVRETPTPGYTSSLGDILETRVKVYAGMTTPKEVQNTKINVNETARISGYKYDDSNENANIDEGENRLKDWTIKLYKLKDSNEVQISSQTTNNSGYYCFEGLLPGEYRVMEVIDKSIWKMTQPGNPNGYKILIKPEIVLRTQQDSIYDREITVGQEAYNVNFGNVKLPIITGTLKIVKTKIDSKGADPVAHANVLFTLKSETGKIIEKRTGEDGIALFNGLEPGLYILNEEVLPGYTSSLAKDWKAGIEAGGMLTVYVENRKIEETGTLKIVKTKIDSKGADPVAHTNVLFTLKSAAGNYEKSIRTDSNGIALFDGLELGQYILNEEVLPGYTSSLAKDWKAGITKGILTVHVVNTKKDEPPYIPPPVVYYPDITVSKSDNDFKAKPGDEIEYGIVVKNIGYASGSMVKVYESLPQYTTFVEGKNEGWKLENGKYVYDIGTMGVNAVKEIKFVVKVDENIPKDIEKVINNVEVKTTSIESSTSNNTASDFTPIIHPTEPEKPVEPEKPILEITKSDDNAEAVGGGEVVYWIMVKNKGKVKAEEVKIFEKLPYYTSFIEGENTGWTASGDGYVYYIGTLDVGESKTISFKVKVDENIPDSVEKLDNTVTLSAKDIDDMSAADDTAVITPPDLPETGRKNSFNPLMGILALIFMAAGILIKKLK